MQQHVLVNMAQVTFAVLHAGCLCNCNAADTAAEQLQTVPTSWESCAYRHMLIDFSYNTAMLYQSRKVGV